MIVIRKNGARASALWKNDAEFFFLPSTDQKLTQGSAPFEFNFVYRCLLDEKTGKFTPQYRPQSFVVQIQ